MSNVLVDVLKCKAGNYEMLRFQGLDPSKVEV